MSNGGPHTEAQRHGDGFRIATADFELHWGTADPLPPGAVPRLREETSYPVFLRALRDTPVALQHRDPVLLGALRAAEGGRVVWGTINFGSQVGRSAFTVSAGGDAHVFEVEVVPTKLGYEDDFRALVDDTQEILGGLALEYLRGAFHAGTPARAGHASHLEWLTLLRTTADDLERALDEITLHPRRAVERQSEPTRADRVRRPDSALRRGILRGAGTGQTLRLAGGVTVRERVDERRALPTLDTPEHRWIAAQLRSIRRRLARVLHAERAHPPGPRRARVLEEIEALSARAARWERLEPFAATRGDPPASFASPQLLHAPGYREAHRACRILAMGLRVHGGPAELVLKDLYLLYEQWCYLWTVRTVADLLGRPLPAAHLLASDDEGLRVRLRRGHEHAVRWDVEGGSVLLAYNPRFEGAGLRIPQRPDVLLEVRRPGRPPLRAILDAKYRIDPSPEYRARYGAPGPPEDALNTLHRYRDALGVSHAVALFPGHAPGRLAADSSIGALPLLPRHDHLAREWLRARIE